MKFKSPKLRRAIEQAVAEAAKQGISGKNVTPFLLAKNGER